MRKKAPGKSYRKGITLKQFLKIFPDNTTAEAWIIEKRWPQGIYCSYCGSYNVKTNCKHKTMPYRCREKECAKRFSTRTGTVMESSKIGFQDWLIALFLFSTSLKSVSSLKLHRDLGISQPSAWFMAHRLRTAMAIENEAFSGPVEVDESYFGGLRRNLSNAQRKNLGADAGRGPIGKTAVVGIKDRLTNRVSAKVIESTDQDTLHSFIEDHAQPSAKVYTDEGTSYESLDFDHETVKHSQAEYVKGDVHVQGVESFWSLLKRAYKGTFHHLSEKHLNRYVQEFAGRHNIREYDTIEQLSALIEGMEDKRLKYRELVG